MKEVYCKDCKYDNRLSVTWCLRKIDSRKYSPYSGTCISGDVYDILFSQNKDGHCPYFEKKVSFFEKILTTFIKI